MHSAVHPHPGGARSRLGSCWLLLLVLGGCADQRGGIITELPDPVFAPTRTVPSRPARVAPRPAPPVFERPSVTSVPPDWRPRGGISGRWRCIVIHHSASTSGGARRFDREHKDRGWDGLGYHFVIGNGTETPSGRVEVGQRWREQKHGAHCKTPDAFYNQHGIGICLVGNFELSRASGAQMDSLARLVSFLLEECGIPVQNVYTHGGVTGKTLCPGRHFSLAELRRNLAAIAS